MVLHHRWSQQPAPATGQGSVDCRHVEMTRVVRSEDHWRLQAGEILQSRNREWKIVPKKRYGNKVLKYSATPPKRKRAGPIRKRRFRFRCGRSCFGPAQPFFKF